jgi:hypothetical protein
VLWDTVEGPGIAVAERFADLLNLVGRGVQRTTDSEIDALRA